MHKIPRYGWWVGVMAMVACGGNADPPDVVTRVDVPSPAQCPAGGSVVSSGLDDNGNGILDITEIATQRVVCHPAPVVQDPVVVRLVAEPPGANCVDGGTAVQSGTDRNGNGELDDREVAHIDYLCGNALVTRLVPEAAGEHCVAGGLAFQIGRDLDNDHALDDHEVQHTQYECGDILAHDIALHSRSDIDALARIRVINGSLQISDPIDGPDGSLEEIVLPALEQVRDTLTISNVKLMTRVRLPALQVVGSTTRITDNGLLAIIEVPKLFRFGGGVEISRNPELLDLTGVIPQTVTGNVLIMDNAALTAAPLAVDVAGRIEVSGNTSLAKLEILASGQIGPVRVAGNGVRDVSVKVREIGGRAAPMTSVEVVDNPDLQLVAIRGDVVGPIELARNTGLDRVEIVANEIDGDLRVTGNPRVDAVSVFGTNFLTDVRGALILSGPVTDLVLFPSRWVFVQGDLTMENTQVHRMPSSLRSVGGKLRLVGNDQLKLGLARFSVGGSIEVRDNPELETLTLLDQDTINGDVDIAFNAKLAGIPGVEVVRNIAGHVVIDNNPALPQLAIAATTIGGALQISNNAALAQLSLAQLQDTDRIELVHNDAVFELSLPSLIRAPELVIDGNATLHHVGLPALTEATSLAIIHNHQLPACEIEALFAGITAQSEVQLDNDDVATCVR